MPDRELSHQLTRRHPRIDAIRLDSVDEHSNPMGSRGAGEIGIVGSAAAVVNAIYHATGVRVRDLPVMCDALLTP